MWSSCAACGSGTLFEDTGFGKVICMSCGTLQSHELACFANVLPRGYGAVVPAKQTYTRFKRFRRYLQRACVNQCNSSVPDETWEYLHAHRPFRGPRDILYCLKKSKLKQKCYDSLPLFTNVLSDVQVPAITTTPCRCSTSSTVRGKRRSPSCRTSSCWSGSWCPSGAATCSRL